MKKLFTVLLVMVLMLSLSACVLDTGTDVLTVEGVELEGELFSYEVGQYTFVTGNLKNTTNNDITDYAVVVEIYDEYDNFIITASKTNQTCIEANSTKYFDVRFVTQDFDLENTKVYIITQEQYENRYGK